MPECVRSRFAVFGLAVCLFLLTSGCNSLRDAWTSRGVPPQSEPDIAEPQGETL